MLADSLKLSVPVLQRVENQTVSKISFLPKTVALPALGICFLNAAEGLSFPYVHFTRYQSINVA